MNSFYQRLIAKADPKRAKIERLVKTSTRAAQGVKKCYCGVFRVRRSGTTDGVAWTGDFCALWECEPLWIDEPERWRSMSVSS